MEQKPTVTPTLSGLTSLDLRLSTLVLYRGVFASPADRSSSTTSRS